MGFGWKEESALEEVALEGHGAGARAGLEECRHHRCRGCSSLLVTSVCAQNDVTAVNRFSDPLNITLVGLSLLIILGDTYQRALVRRLRGRRYCGAEAGDTIRALLCCLKYH